MHSRYNQFRKSKLGSDLEKLIDTSDRYIEYRVLSRLGIPAVAALVEDLNERFPEIEFDLFARQFCGSMVGEVMRRHRHTIVRDRVSVPGKFFTHGVVWSAKALPPPDDEQMPVPPHGEMIQAANECQESPSPMH